MQFLKTSFFLRFSALLLSTAAEQHNAGDNFHGDDTNDDESHSVTHVRMVEMRASKLEEQVRDLTVGPATLEHIVWLLYVVQCPLCFYNLSFHVKS